MARPNGLDISRVATPIGVIGIIYESRPNVTADAAALCLKSGNVCILRGGSGSDPVEQRDSRRDRQLCSRSRNCPRARVELVPTPTGRLSGEMLAGLDGAIDLIIPRGGKSLVARVQAEARVPVLAHLEGICHVYVHAKADPAKARAIALNAKMRRTGVCGAAETLLIDRGVLSERWRCRSCDDLRDAGCEIRGDEHVARRIPDAKPATEEDWRTEYLDAIIAVKAVDGVEDAIRISRPMARITPRASSPRMRPRPSGSSPRSIPPS